MRPALNLRCDEVDAEAGLFTVRTALLGPRANSDLILPTAPLGRMHGDAAGRALEAAGASVLTDARVASLDELDAEAIVVAVPPRESARLLGEDEPALEDSPIVSVHLWFDRPLLEQPLAALLGSDAHWVFDRGALTGSPPEQRPVPDRRLERRARAARGARARARRADRRPAHRAARRGGAPLVASEPRAVRDDRASSRRRAARGRDLPPQRRPRGHLDRHGLAGDDGERGPKRSQGGSAHLEQPSARVTA